jgi:hypothetical protein
MTYKSLLNHLSTMSDAELGNTVTILIESAGEFAGVVEIAYSDDSDSLEVGTPYLIIE